MLDKLDLSYNMIQHIGNQTFRGLSNLRTLIITHNSLKTLDPATVTGYSYQIYNIDFSHNELEVLEFSNAISDTNFCEINFSNNRIKEIINTINYELDPKHKKYHGGEVNMNHNKLTKFIDFEKLGIKYIQTLGGLFEYGFVMTDTKWICDCRMEPFLELAEDTLKRFCRDYFNISCWTPLEHRGNTIPQIVNNGQLDTLICNVTENCPRGCHCFEQPKEVRIAVNCINANLKRLPDVLPESRNLTLILANNKI